MSVPFTYIFQVEISNTLVSYHSRVLRQNTCKMSKETIPFNGICDKSFVHVLQQQTNPHINAINTVRCRFELRSYSFSAKVNEGNWGRNYVRRAWPETRLPSAYFRHCEMFDHRKFHWLVAYFGIFCAQNESFFCVSFVMYFIIIIIFHGTGSMDSGHMHVYRDTSGSIWSKCQFSIAFECVELL